MVWLAAGNNKLKSRGLGNSERPQSACVVEQARLSGLQAMFAYLMVSGSKLHSTPEPFSKLLRRLAIYGSKHDSVAIIAVIYAQPKRSRIVGRCGKKLDLQVIARSIPG